VAHVLRCVLRPLNPTGYVFPAEADERIDVRRIIDLLQHPAGIRESSSLYLARLKINCSIGCPSLWFSFLHTLTISTMTDREYGTSSLEDDDDKKLESLGYVPSFKREFSNLATVCDSCLFLFLNLIDNLHTTD
jgi:hypothetical protein